MGQNRPISHSGCLIKVHRFGKNYTTTGSDGRDYYELWVVAVMNDISYAQILLSFLTGKIKAFKANFAIK